MQINLIAQTKTTLTDESARKGTEELHWRPLPNASISATICNREIVMTTTGKNDTPKSRKSPKIKASVHQDVFTLPNHLKGATPQDLADIIFKRRESKQE